MQPRVRRRKRQMGVVHAEHRHVQYSMPKGRKGKLGGEREGTAVLYSIK